MTQDKTFRYLALLFLGIFAAFSAVSQDIQYSQFYANVLYLNPAFAGNAHALRGMLHQRVQWPALDAKYITSHLSVDHYFSKTNSGLGLMVYKDWQGASTLSSTEVALQYAYELHLSGTFSFRVGLQAAHVSRNLNYWVLSFPDQYSANGYLGNQTSQPAPNARINYWDFTSGGIFYSDIFWLGATYAHMNTPDQSFYGAQSKLPYKMDFTGGVRINLANKTRSTLGMDEGEVYLTPTVHYKSQGKSDQFDLGVYLLNRHLITGIWYRGIPLLKKYRKGLQNNESFVLIGGWRVNGLSISYSFDATISKLAPANTGGSHELNITYVYNLSRNKKKVMKKIPCPDFYK